MPNTHIEENTIWRDRALSGSVFMFDNVRTM
jgi:hypothetical protein